MSNPARINVRDALRDSLDNLRSADAQIETELVRLGIYKTRTPSDYVPETVEDVLNSIAALTWRVSAYAKKLAEYRNED